MLQQAAKEKFEDSIAKCWSGESFPRIIQEVYGATSSSASENTLRNIVANIAFEHVEELYKRLDFMSTLRQIPDFGSDLFGLLAAAYSHGIGTGNKVKDTCIALSGPGNYIAPLTRCKSCDS